MFAPLAIAGLSALGGLFGNRKQQVPTDTRFNKNTTGNFQNYGTRESATDVNLLPEAQGLLTPLSQRYQQMLANPLHLQPNIDQLKATNIADINRAGDIRDQNLQESLAARGINGPAVGTSIAHSMAQRFADITRNNQDINRMSTIDLPIFERQNALQEAGAAGNFFSQIPHNLRTGEVTSNSEDFNQNESGTGQQQTTYPGNQMGGLFGSLGQTLAYLYGQGAFGGGMGR